MKKKSPDKDLIIRKLQAHKSDLERYGVKRIGLFGSFVRGKQNSKSDIDLMVEFDLEAFGKDLHGLFDTYLQLSEYLENLLGKKVDLLTPAGVDSIRIKEIAEGIRRSIAYV